MLVLGLYLEHFADATRSLLGLNCLRLLSLDESDSSRFSALILLFLFLDSKLVDLGILILAHAAVTPRGLGIAAILLLVRVAAHLPLESIRLPLQLQEGLKYISTHLVIVGYLEFSNPVILQVPEEGALYGKDVCYVQLLE